MTFAEPPATLDLGKASREMASFIRELYPICRSITGEGLRSTLRAIQRRVPIALHEVPSGTKVFDWTIPDEWNISDAYVLDAWGRRVIDFRQSNLHVVNYSEPVRSRLPLAELKKHLHTLPECPDWIPYRTAYYERSWGFCLRHRDLDSLLDGEYEAVIESRLEPGSLTYGELLLQGETEEEVLISCHCCHPSLGNDNLSGIAVATFLAQSLAGARRRYSYRFLFLPGTIGSITWLSRNEGTARRIRHGLVVACVGDAGPLHYKKSRRGDAEIDRAAVHVLRHSGREHQILDFSPYGYDERQYNSPGFDLPVGSLTRTPHGRYAEYHTSADDLELVRPESLGDSLATYVSVAAVLEGNARFVNTNPKCEPQLGRRGLYRAIGGLPDPERHSLAMLWVLNLSDGIHDLLSIAERSDLPFQAVEAAARRLREHGLLRPATPDGAVKWKDSGESK
jgi:aminopeptidase-like protein